MGSIVGSQVGGPRGYVGGDLDVLGTLTVLAGILGDLTGTLHGSVEDGVSGSFTGPVTVGTLNGFTLLVGAADPSAGGGVVATRPALYGRTGTDQIWVKTGAGDTAWSRLAFSSGDTFPTATITSAAITTLNVAGIITHAATSPTIFGADQTDFSGSGSTPISRWSASTPVNVYSRTGSSLQKQTIHNVGAQTITVVSDNGSNGTAALRYKLRAASKAIVADAAFENWYDPTTARWRMQET